MPLLPGTLNYGVVILATFLCCSSQLVQAQAESSITDPIEVKALLEIKRSLLDPNENLSNWNRGDPCTSSWTGVSCTSRDIGYLHVEELNLLGMNLSGTLSSEIGRLSYMRILDFMWNNISGSIPKEIGNITSLELLLLSGNQLTGPLPEEMGYLPSLMRIQIDQNKISGPIPESFANLNNTKHFYMNNNSISGQIPPELSRLPSLIHFLLDNNNLSGYLPPQFSELPSLLVLQVDNNNFEGTIIPPSYGNMSRLLKLSLRNCNLQGSIPDMSRIPNLHYLDLSSNKLSGSIPTSMLSENITTIDLSNNNITGHVPVNFSRLPNIQALLLANNSLVGSLPSVIWQNRTFNGTARMIGDLRNNGLTNISGSTNLPPNVSVWLQGNPICTNTNLVQYCGSQDSDGEKLTNTTTSSFCPPQACPPPFEFVKFHSLRCLCALPLIIHYRLKSPGFSYFSQYKNTFLEYLSSSLFINLYQLEISAFTWQKGPRLKMELKIFPAYSSSSLFIRSELLQIIGMFTDWQIPDSDLFGPYELLGFDLLGPYKEDFISNIPPALSNKKHLAMIVGIAVGIGVAGLFALVLLFRIVHQRRKAQAERDKALLGIDVKPYTFNYSELKAATEDFNPINKLGEGGFGPVFKGMLNDGRAIAVKQLSLTSQQGKNQFVAEIATISAVQHRNLIKLHGCCVEGDKTLLVYEYLEKKSLDQALFGERSLVLEWGTRYEICLGIARGLAYLHEESRLRIVHRDIKASNILLDSDHVPKISDFGLAKLYDDKKTHISTRVAGTIGYLAPEYAMRGHLTEKADVFAFGIVALEIIGGRPNSDPSLEEDKVYLLELAWQLYENNREVDLVDSRLSTFNEDEAKRMFGVALLCTQTSPVNRPSMSRVVAMLCGDIEVSRVATKPGYLTDWKFCDQTNFMSELSTSKEAEKSGYYNTSLSSSTPSGGNLSPVDAGKPMLHEIIGEGIECMWYYS